MRAPSVLHLFAGAGGGALGFKHAGFLTVGAIDVDPLACAAYEYLTGEPATCADLATITPAGLRAACSERPDVVFASPPCKSFSGCLPSAKAETARYREMSSFALRGVWLALEAWKVPPPIILLENVPRIMSRGADWLRQIEGLLRSYGYAVSMRPHCCGEVGGLAQRRRRFLLIARHMKQVPAFVYEPPKRPLLGVGDVLGELPVPLPGSSEGGPMHRLPRLSAMNWVRLALIPAGGDWRDLPESVAINGSEHRHNGKYGVEDWREPSPTVIAEARTGKGWAGVADPRLPRERREGSLGVTGWADPSTTVIGRGGHHNGPWQVADPRLKECGDPSVDGGARHKGKLGVEGWDEPSHTIMASAGPQRGHGAVVVDPRLNHDSRPGNLGVTGWAEPTHTVIGSASGYHGNNVADPRVPEVVGPPIDLEAKRPCYLVIRAADGTWHRPLTTLELAVIQSFPAEHRGEWLCLPGNDAQRRSLIGNAVPPKAAEAIARAILDALAMARDGRTFRLSAEDIWVRDEQQELQA